MPVYEAEFLGAPTPIKSSKKNKKQSPVTVQDIEKSATPIDAPYGLNKKGKPYKRPQKIQETTPPPSVSSESSEPKKGKRKQAEPVVEPEQPPAKKKRVVKPKPQPSEQAIAAAVEEKPNANDAQVLKAARKRQPRIKKIVDGEAANQPPGWFKAWVLDDKKRQNDMKPKAEKVSQPILKEEAKQVATEKWKDDLTRDRVNHEVDNHMSRLYQQIYGRKFK